MAILEFLRLALFAITRNKTRAFLTMLGIIIGVAAVIAMIGIGEGSRKASIDIIENMGSNMLTIFNGGGSSSNSRMGPLGLGSVAVLQDSDAEVIERD
jgi:putative ABC transport system permease protein